LALGAGDCDDALAQSLSRSSVAVIVDWKFEASRSLKFFLWGSGLSRCICLPDKPQSPQPASAISTAKPIRSSQPFSFTGMAYWKNGPKPPRKTGPSSPKTRGSLHRRYGGRNFAPKPIKIRLYRKYGPAKVTLVTVFRVPVSRTIGTPLLGESRRSPEFSDRIKSINAAVLAAGPSNLTVSGKEKVTFRKA